MPETDEAETTFPEERRFDPEQRLIWLRIRLDADAALALPESAFATWIGERLERELGSLVEGRLEIPLNALLRTEEEEE
jgi:hypothetical protein